MLEVRVDHLWGRIKQELYAFLPSKHCEERWSTKKGTHVLQVCLFKTVQCTPDSLFILIFKYKHSLIILLDHSLFNPYRVYVFCNHGNFSKGQKLQSYIQAIAAYQSMSIELSVPRKALIWRRLEKWMWRLWEHSNHMILHRRLSEGRLCQCEQCGKSKEIGGVAAGWNIWLWNLGKRSWSNIQYNRNNLLAFSLSRTVEHL